MKNILILGAGSAGTIMANHLARKVNRRDWKITIVDAHTTHYYQPGFLVLPFGIYSPEQVQKPKSTFIPSRVDFLQKRVEIIETEKNSVTLSDGTDIPYDILIIATGARIAPGETDGLTGDHWHKSAFDFYTIEGATALRDRLATWEGGNLVVHITEMPIKCPVAPLEFICLADDFFRRRKMRDRVNLTYVTPLSSAFTKPTAARVLGHMLDSKGITLVPDFEVEAVDGEARKISSYGGKTVDYDLLVTIPTNMGDALIERSGMGDDLNFIPTDPHTLQSKAKENVFVIGDATDIPASKAGSVAHFEAEILTENILSFMEGKPLEGRFDGHANCFIESGNRKAFLIDFNYEVEPVEGTFPIPGIGPFQLLKETGLNHIGKLAFRHIYWNLLLKGRGIPTVGAHMSLRGKKINKEA
ncbi:MAG: NAD(P)/FAD-dependent oxidoreductase [Spirochaetales bacterium]|nr:MAG: NAD(P)/FAD-dependent oxidoreductase [Spirochaetales bacterium]